MEPNEFTDLVLKSNPGPFQPTAWYDSDGDCIEFIAADESYYGERFDSLVTVYYGQKTNAIVGCMIKGVSKFLERLKSNSKSAMRILIEGDNVKLEWLFAVHLSTIVSDDNVDLHVYRNLMEVADKADLEVSLSSVPANQ